MINWISNKRSENIIRKAHEQKLRKSLAEKISRYQEPSSEPTDDSTVICIDGEQLRVTKEQITITDVLTGSLTKSL